MASRGNLLDDRQTYDVIGAAMDVHRELGCGFLERVSVYKRQLMAASYVVDYVCYGTLIVEIKALATLGPIEHAQAINYLRLSGLRRALLLNFGARSLQFKRILCDPESIGRHRFSADSVAGPIGAGEL